MNLPMRFDWYCISYLFNSFIPCQFMSNLPIEINYFCILLTYFLLGYLYTYIQKIDKINIHIIYNTFIYHKYIKTEKLINKMYNMYVNIKLEYKHHSWARPSRGARKSNFTISTICLASKCTTYGQFLIKLLLFWLHSADLMLSVSKLSTRYNNVKDFQNNRYYPIKTPTCPY